MKNRGKLYKNLVLFLIPLITIIIIFSWFKEGKIISNNSEENLDILHSQDSAKDSQTVWSSIGTGFKSGFSLPKYPTFALLGILERIGFSASLRQAIFLSFLMIMGMFSMYLLMRKGFNFSNSISLIGGIFYNLNIYSMTQIWKRFLYAHMVALAYFPLFLFLWIKWIDTTKVIWLFLFLMTSLFFTYAFSQPAFIITLWIPAGIFVLVKVWKSRHQIDEAIRIFLRMLIGLILWGLVNIWWLYPMLTLRTIWTGTAGQSWEADLSSLHAVSKSFPLWEVLLLRQSWYLGHENDFFDFYHNPFIYFTSLTILILAIYGLIRSKGQTLRGYIIILAGVGLFISKGTSSPFGYSLFSFLFSNFPLTTAFRNSYEKFGIVWLLPYTIFFSLGFYHFFLRIKYVYKNLYLILVLFLFCVLLIFPMWSGDIFPSKHRVVLPDYYIEANSFLNSQFIERKFHIPYLAEPNPIIFDWGYVGIDPSTNIFDSEDLSSADPPLYNKTLKLLSSYFDNKNVTSIFGLLGIQYIILQRDIVYPGLDFVKTKQQIESWQGIYKSQIFGKLDFYFLDPKIVKPRIYASGTIVKSNSLDEALNLVAADEWNETSAFIFQDIGIELDDNLTPRITFTKISPTKYIVNIRESKDSYVLILNNTFDESWKIKIDNQIVNKHFMINGFANGWLIDKKGDYDIEIKLKVWPWD